MDFPGSVPGFDSGTHDIERHIGGIKSDLEEFADLIGAMAEHHGPPDAGAVAFDLGADGEVDDFAAPDLAHGGTADRLVGIRAGAAPDRITCAFGSGSGHGGGRDTAEFGFGHTRLDVFEDRLETGFGRLGGGFQTFHFHGALLHEDRADHIVRGHHVGDTANGCGQFGHHRIRKKIPAAETDLLQTVLRHDVRPFRQGRTRIVRLGGFTEVHQLDDLGDFGTAGRESQGFWTDQQGGFTLGGDQNGRGFEARPVVGKVADRSRFRFGRKDHDRIETVLADGFLGGLHPAGEFL